MIVWFFPIWLYHVGVAPKQICRIGVGVKHRVNRKVSPSENPLVGEGSKVMCGLVEQPWTYNHIASLNSTTGKMLSTLIRYFTCTCLSPPRSEMVSCSGKCYHKATADRKVSPAPR